MTGLVARALAAHAVATSQPITTHEASAPLRQPDVFERTAYIVEEIDHAAIKALGHAVKLKAARASGDLPMMREAAAAVQRLSAQVASLAATVGRVTARAGETHGAPETMSAQVDSLEAALNRVLAPTQEQSQASGGTHAR